MSLAWASAAFFAAVGAFGALSMAMDRHYEDSYGRGKKPGKIRLWLQTGGAAGLVLSLLASLALNGRAQGWVLWLGELTAGAIVVVLLLTYAPRRVLPLALVSGLLALIAVLAAALR